MVSIGEQFPDIELPNQDGRMVRLSDFRGKKIVLFAFPKSGSPGCTMQACSFRDAYPQMTISGAVVLGISADSPKDLKSWKTNRRLQYDLLSDESGEVLRALGVWGFQLNIGIKFTMITRSHWVIDENGIVLDAAIGVNPIDSAKRAAAALAAANEPSNA